MIVCSLADKEARRRRRSEEHEEAEEGGGGILEHSATSRAPMV
jgi:hypothetical protein